MLHTKFRGNGPAGSGEGHLGHVTRIILTNFHSLEHESFHTKFSSEWPSSF